MTATAKIILNVDGVVDGTLDIGTATHKIQYGPSFAWGDGTGADQIKQIFTDQRTLAASASEDLDLSGVLTNAFGVAIAFTKIRGIIIKAAATNTNNVIVGGASATQFATWVGAATHTIVVRPGGMFALFAPDVTGYAVTAATADLLKIANSAGSSSVTYDILLFGTV